MVLVYLPEGVGGNLNATENAFARLALGLVEGLQILHPLRLLDQHGAGILD